MGTAAAGFVAGRGPDWVDPGDIPLSGRVGEYGGDVVLVYEGLHVQQG